MQMIGLAAACGTLLYDYYRVDLWFPKLPTVLLAGSSLNGR